jgi:hypothetical protein
MDGSVPIKPVGNHPILCGVSFWIMGTATTNWLVLSLGCVSRFYNRPAHFSQMTPVAYVTSIKIYFRPSLLCLYLFFKGKLLCAGHEFVFIQGHGE